MFSYKKDIKNTGFMVDEKIYDVDEISSKLLMTKQCIKKIYENRTGAYPDVTNFYGWSWSFQQCQGWNGENMDRKWWDDHWSYEKNRLMLIKGIIFDGARIAWSVAELTHKPVKMNYKLGVPITTGFFEPSVRRPGEPPNDWEIVDRCRGYDEWPISDGSLRGPNPNKQKYHDYILLERKVEGKDVIWINENTKEPVIINGARLDER